MALEDKLWRIAHQELSEGRVLALCTVIRARGSTPRELGARMLVGESGLLAGTVGGGCGEADVAVLARKVVAGFQPHGVVDVDLSGDFDQNEIQACGGNMDVLVEKLDAGQSDLIRRLAEIEEKRDPAFLITKLGKGESQPSSLLVREGESPSLPCDVRDALSPNVTQVVNCDAGEYFVQHVGTRDELVIVGSGHVAQPLASMAAMLAYRIRVIDDRSSYVTQDRFPDATDLEVGKHSQLLEQLPPNEHRNIVIITRGHQHDEASLRAALSLDPLPQYVGMIGSKRRALGTLKRLAEDGFEQDVLNCVASPIGLDIGALSPEEIALAVLAEIVCIKRGGSGRPLKELRTRPKSAPDSGE